MGPFFDLSQKRVRVSCGGYHLFDEFAGDAFLAEFLAEHLPGTRLAIYASLYVPGGELSVVQIALARESFDQSSLVAWA